MKFMYILMLYYRSISGHKGRHPEGTSNGSDNSDFLKVSDFNGSLWNVKVFSLKII